jgi:hypothetical protein
MPALETTMSADLEQGNGIPPTRSWENVKKADGMKDRASTMHNLKFYGALWSPYQWFALALTFWRCR